MSDADARDIGRSVVVGVGLNSTAVTADVVDLITEALAGIGRTLADVSCIATAERRRQHPALTGLTELAELGLDLHTFPDTAFDGRAICERAAALAAPHGEVLVSKRCSANVCICVVAMNSGSVD